MNRIVPRWDDRVLYSDVAKPRMYLRVSLLEHVDLRDAVLAGHSIGTGEVTATWPATGQGEHHALRPGHHRPPVAQGVLVSLIPCTCCRRRQPRRGAAKPVRRVRPERLGRHPAWMTGFLDTFYNIDTGAAPLSATRPRSFATGALAWGKPDGQLLEEA
jgi:pimeloyl-ACP methyl ester carboxylesterase